MGHVWRVILNEYLTPGLLIAGGFAVLIAGGEVLVRGAVGIAKAARIAPLVIGLTVVAFCTSAPELAVVLEASFMGQGDLAVGNIVGSCICNVLLVLGLSALVGPLVVSARLVRLEVPLMIAAAVAVLVLGLDGSIDRRDGLILFAAMLVYMVWTVLTVRRESRQVQEELAHLVRDGDELESQEAKPKRRAGGIGAQLMLIVAGVAMLVVASGWLVEGSVTIAKLLGVSELIIGLTVLAIGTSLPEVATCVIASVRGYRDLAVGNVVGSNILNILAVLGLSAAVAPAGIDVSAEALKFDIPVMIAVSVACLPIFFTGWKIERWEGGLFLGYYVLYLAYLVGTANPDDLLTRQFVIIILVFVVPLTAITLTIGVWRTWRTKAE